MPFIRPFAPHSRTAVIRFAAFAVMTALISGACAVRSPSGKVPSAGALTDAAGSAGPDAAADDADPLAIPFSARYTLRYADRALYVYDADGRPVYRSALPAFDPLTDADRALLERDGIVYTSRSELVEFLLSLETGAVS